MPERGSDRRGTRLRRRHGGEPTNVRCAPAARIRSPAAPSRLRGGATPARAPPSGHSRRDARQARPETRMCPGPVEHWGLQAFGDTPSQAPYHSSSIAMPDGSLRATNNLQTFQRAAALFRNSRGFVQVALVITFSSSAFVFVMVRGAGSRPSIAGRQNCCWRKDLVCANCNGGPWRVDCAQIFTVHRFSQARGCSTRRLRTPASRRPTARTSTAQARRSAVDRHQAGRGDGRCG